MDLNYLKEHLDQVIVRLDFLPPFDLVNENVPSELQKIIMQTFPIAEPKELISKEFQISASQATPSKVDEKSEKINEWNYYDRSKSKRLCLTKNAFFILYSKYDSFDVLKKDFLSITSFLFKLKPDLQCNRIGLRYVNVIDESDSDIFSWPKINTNLLSTFEIAGDGSKNNISRAFHNLELNYGDYNLRFHFGIYNPDYPASIRKKQFILDYDAYYMGLIGGDVNLDELVSRFHTGIKELINKC